MKKLFFSTGLLAMVSLAGINVYAQTSVSGSAGGSATVSGSAQAGTGVAQPGVIAYPLPPRPYPYPQDNDIVQFNNLTIKNVSSLFPPAEIIAGYSYEIMPMMGVNAKNPEVRAQESATANITAKCFRYSDTNAKAAAIPCPTAAAISASGTTQVQLKANPAGGSLAPSIVPIYPLPPEAAYRIEVDTNTRLRLRDQSPATLADFAAGDQINVYGIYNSDGSVQALIMRNTSKPVEKQFIQLNNVQVVSIFSATAPADIVVIQEQIYPCYGFGADGTSARRALPCPMNSSKVGANLTVPKSMMPIWNTARKYVVHVDAQTILLDRNKLRITLSGIKQGDKLNVYGSTPGGTETIDADVVRDLTQPAVATNLSGTITQVNADGSFIIQTNDGSTYTVQNPIRVGTTIKLKGLLGELQKIISQISEMTIRNIQSYCPTTPPDCHYANPTSCESLTCYPGDKVSIELINPESGSVGTSITLKGSGFAAVNVVHFGDYGVVPKIASSNGATLTFAVPSALSPLCYFSTPACMVPSRITEPGVYSVWVSNGSGESNKVQFTVTASSSAP